MGTTENSWMPPSDAKEDDQVKYICQIVENNYFNYYALVFPVLCIL
jgi:hypothetical protein